MGLPRLLWDSCSIFTTVLLPLCWFASSISSASVKGLQHLLTSLHPTWAKVLWSILGWQCVRSLNAEDPKSLHKRVRKRTPQTSRYVNASSGTLQRDQQTVLTTHDPSMPDQPSLSILHIGVVSAPRFWQLSLGTSPHQAAHGSFQQLPHNLSCPGKAVPQASDKAIGQARV